MASRTHAALIAAWFAAVWSVLAYVGLLTISGYSTASTTSTGAVMYGRASIADVNGPAVYGTLAIPLVAAILALIAVKHPGRRWLLISAAVVATLFTFLAAMSVGLFYAPTAVGLLVAALTSPDQSTAT